MARSGSVNYAVTAADIITDALRKLKVLPAGAGIGTDQSTDGMRALNLIVKTLANTGCHLNVLTEGTLFLVEDREVYTLGTGGDHAATAYVKTEIATAASSGDLTIDVDSITGISNADKIGVELDGGSIQWTTVNGVPAGGVITLAAALTDEVAADNHVYAYTTIIEMPQRILQGTIRLENSDGTETPVRLVTREEYFQLPNKATPGKCNQVYYDQQYGALGYIYTWPTCEDVQCVLHFTFERLIQDLDLTTENTDFPIGAQQMLVYALAVDLATSYPRVDPNNMVWLKGLRDELVDDYLSRDSEDGSLFIQPYLR
jgi:hypothetical protein